jgi:hypothetical protein
VNQQAARLEDGETAHLLCGLTLITDENSVESWHAAEWVLFYGDCRLFGAVELCGAHHVGYDCMKESGVDFFAAVKLCWMQVLLVFVLPRYVSRNAEWSSLTGAICIPPLLVACCAFVRGHCAVVGVKETGLLPPQPRRTIAARGILGVYLGTLRLVCVDIGLTVIGG